MSNQENTKIEQPKGDLSAKDYEQIGRRLESSLIGFSITRKKLFSLNLLLGIVRGFGAVIGATIGIAILLYILSIFTHIPLIGPLVQDVKQTVNTSTQP